jgi:hypothetical protein
MATFHWLGFLPAHELRRGILNRNGLVTGYGNRWTRERVTSLRSHHRIAVYKSWSNSLCPARLTAQISVAAPPVEGAGDSPGRYAPIQGRWCGLPVRARVSWPTPAPAILERATGEGIAWQKGLGNRYARV